MESRIATVAVADGPYLMDQIEINHQIRKHYGDRLGRRTLDVFDKVLSHPSIRQRRFAFDRPEELVDEDPDRRIDRFTRWAIDLSERAARDAMTMANITPREVSALVVNTCTGYLCPGISTYLIERLDLDRRIGAFDLVGAGCGGAVPNLQMAKSLLAENPNGIVLSVSVEICSATFQMGDDLALVISNALFSDGAAAAILWNRPQGMAMVASASRHAPEHRRHIRYIYKKGQLHNQLSTRLPELAAATVGQMLRELLEPHKLKPADILHWAMHPGGENVLGAIQAELGLDEHHLRHTRYVLAHYGNLSSPTVWLVLREILENGIQPGDRCVLTAFGAGLSAHGYLLQA